MKTTIEIDDKLDKRFRETVARTKGLHKGVISEALQEAITQWIEEQARKRSDKND